jgi:hypothetical protein
MMEKRQPLQQMMLGKVVICLQKTETRSMFITLYSVNSKWIKDFNIRSETLKLLQERTGNILEATGIGKDFLNKTPATQQQRQRMDKWNYIKLNFLHNTPWKAIWRLLTKLNIDLPYDPAIPLLGIDPK